MESIQLIDGEQSFIRHKRLQSISPCHTIACRCITENFTPHIERGPESIIVGIHQLGSGNISRYTHPGLSDQAETQMSFSHFIVEIICLVLKRHGLEVNTRDTTLRQCVAVPPGIDGQIDNLILNQPSAARPIPVMVMIIGGRYPMSGTCPESAIVKYQRGHRCNRYTCLKRTQAAPVAVGQRVVSLGCCNKKFTVPELPGLDIILCRNQLQPIAFQNMDSGCGLYKEFFSTSFNRANSFSGTPHSLQTIRNQFEITISCQKNVTRLIYGDRAVGDWFKFPIGNPGVGVGQVAILIEIVERFCSALNGHIHRYQIRKRAKTLIEYQSVFNNDI